MGITKCTIIGILWVYAIFLGITFLTDIYPQGKFTKYQFVPPTALKGNLARNGRLNHAEVIFKGQVYAAESLTLHKGDIYTGLITSEIVKLTKDLKLEVVFESVMQSKRKNGPLKGWPMSLKFDEKEEYLYATDFTFGIIRIDVNTKQTEVIVSIGDKIEGKRPALAYSLDIARNGDIYWSDVCAGVVFDDSFLPIVLGDPCGRLIRYRPETKRNEVLVRDLGVANGVALARDESFVLVAESSTSRIVKYHLKGPKTGKAEVLIAGLPGTPNNINLDNADGFLVALPAYFDASDPSYVHLLAPRPHLRKFILKIGFVLVAPFKYLHRLFPFYDPTVAVEAVNSLFDDILYSPTSAVLRFDENGRITDAAYMTNGVLTGLSAAQIYGDELWLGSYQATYMARIPLKRALPTLAK